MVDALYKENRKWRLLILGSMIGSCRRGELIGLEWPFVNFKQDILTVENNIPYTKDGQAVEKKPKSGASYRDIDMPAWYMKELAIYEEEWHEQKDFLEDKWEVATGNSYFTTGRANLTIISTHRSGGRDSAIDTKSVTSNFTD